MCIVTSNYIQLLPFILKTLSMEKNDKHNIKINLKDFPELINSTMDAEEYFERAEFFRKTKDYKEAILAYTDSIKSGINNLRAHVSRAICYLHTKEMDLALADVNYAINNLPKNDLEEKAIYLEIRSRIHFENKDEENAVRDLKESCQTYPTEAYEKLGDYYLKKGNFEEALEFYKSMFTGMNANAKYAFKMSFCYMKLNEKSLARKYANLALNAGFENAKVLIKDMDRMGWI